MSKNPLPVRSPLDVLQVDFPDYRISVQNIWDKLFYIAEAREPGIQPRFDVRRADDDAALLRR